VLKVRKAGIVGAGVMGSQIACHLANVGIPVRLLDVPPNERLPEEIEAGVAEDDPKVRNRITRTLFDHARKLKPQPLYLTEMADRITLGNVEDDLDTLADVDWVVEVVVERLDIKRALHRKIESIVSPDAIITTNTSGIPLHTIAEGSRDVDRRRFFGTHFFNPPRYLRLLELIPTADTDLSLLEEHRSFAESVLGKSTVTCKDTPGFVANRIGCFAIQDLLWLMTEEGFTIDEIDAITGPPLGRSRAGTFRLGDVVGVDLLAQIGDNLYEALVDDPSRERMKVPDFVREMVRRGWHGQKTGQGFYKRVRGAKGAEILTLDPNTLEYLPRQKPAFQSVATASGITDPGERIRAMVESDDRAGQFAWKHLRGVLCYAADRVPEIADDVVTVDRAMRWGYNWELGPFEICDALGPASLAQRLEKEGQPVPKLLEELLSSGHDSFYSRSDSKRQYFDLGKRSVATVPPEPGAIRLGLLRQAGKVVRSNPGASLIDLGEGVACVEFHSKMNTIGDDQLNMIQESLDVVREDFQGMVIGNQGEHFSAGANLFLILSHIQNEDWDEVELAIRTFQRVTCALRTFEKPVVVACHGYTLGGGCEITLGADHVMIAAETYLGLPEVGVGVIPAAGGTKEMLIRCTEAVNSKEVTDYFPGLARAFETIGMAKIGTSAHEGLRNGHLRASETTIHVQGERRLEAAKAKVLDMAEQGYVAPLPRTDIVAVGSAGLAALKLQLYYMHEGGYISDHDKLIGSKVAYTLTGGDLSGLHRVSEQYILDLELEAFLSLCGEAKTVQRIQHMLKTGKPLRN
jgi:3-hydroxyacyl-CoA dehydrogenase